MIEQTAGRAEPRAMVSLAFTKWKVNLKSVMLPAYFLQYTLSVS